MGLFGEKCARCNSERSDGEYDGIPTCESCQEIIEAKLKAAREITRVCPVDESEMEKEVRAFAAQVGAACGLPVYGVDERLTSEEADRRLRSQGLHGRAVTRQRRQRRPR